MPKSSLVTTYLAALLLLAGCASQIPYTAQPQKVEDPVRTFDRLMSKHWQPTPLRVEFGEDYGRIIWTFDGELKARVVTFSQLRTTKIFSFRGQFGVAAYDETGAEHVSLFVPTLEVAQEFADTFMALGASRPRP
ncbi:MAG: hypothetical protein MUC96_19095 [Myxococcaceae bacterium]|nr:hypothetical protein [Myxococcaceae bacterium]